MTDFLKSRTPGEAFPNDHRTINAWNDATRRVLESGDAGGGLQLSIPDQLRLIICNETGEDLVRGNSVKLMAVNPTYATGQTDYEARDVLVKGLVPDDFANPVGVLLDEIEDGKTGPVAVSGFALAKVNILATDHVRCGAQDGMAALESSDNGGVASIIAKATSTTGEQMCLILFGAAGLSGQSSTHPGINCLCDCVESGTSACTAVGEAASAWDVPWSILDHDTGCLWNDEAMSGIECGNEFFTTELNLGTMPPTVKISEWNGDPNSGGTLTGKTYTYEYFTFREFNPLCSGEFIGIGDQDWTSAGCDFPCAFCLLPRVAGIGCEEHGIGSTVDVTNPTWVTSPATTDPCANLTAWGGGSPHLWPTATAVHYPASFDLSDLESFVDAATSCRFKKGESDADALCEPIGDPDQDFNETSTTGSPCTASGGFSLLVCGSTPRRFSAQPTYNGGKTCAVFSITETSPGTWSFTITISFYVHWVYDTDNIQASALDCDPTGEWAVFSALYSTTWTLTGESEPISSPKVMTNPQTSAGWAKQNGSGYNAAGDIQVASLTASW